MVCRRPSIPIFLPAPKERKLELEGSVTDSMVEVVKNGIYKAEGVKCWAGEYPYTERRRTQVGTYTAMPTLLGLPLKLQWSIRTGYLGEPEITLVGNEGSVVILVSKHSPFKLPGGSSTEGPAKISYTMSGNQIQLANDPDDEVYGFYLRVRATEPGGETFEAEDVVQFEGHDATIGGGYNEKVAACMAEVLTHPPLDYRWPAVDLPSVDRILDFVRAVSTSGDPAADEIIAEAKLAHGASFHRALAPQAITRFAADGDETGLGPLAESVLQRERFR